MQYLDAISITTERSLFISKANHSISQLSKSMPEPVMLKKLKLNGSMKTYFPGGSEVKASARNMGDSGSILGSGRSPGEGNGNPLQYSCLENFIEREAL